MVSIFENEVAKIINDAASPYMLDATLTRDGSTTGPEYDPSTPTSATSYACRAIEDSWGEGVLASGRVDATDTRILVIANSLAVTPKPLDRITLRGRTYVVAPDGVAGVRPIESDPARATWSLRCRG